MKKRITNLAITVSLISSILASEHSYVYAMEDYLRKEESGENIIFDIPYGEFYFDESDFTVSENGVLKVCEEKEADEEALEQERIEAYNECIREYASYFKLDGDVIIEIAREYTNDYTYAEDFFINGKAYNILDKDLFAMAIVYNIYTNSDAYEINRSEITVDNTITYLNYDPEGIVLDNGYNFNDFVSFICEKVDVDRSLVLAICEYETGYLASDQAIYKNNFGGLKGYNGYITYPTPEAGIISMVLNLDRIYEVYPINNMRDLSGAYVNGCVSRPSDHWVGCVCSIQNDILENEDEVFVYTLK